MTDAAQHLTRYYVCVEEPKGSDRWAIRGDVRASSPSEAKLIAYETWPAEGPFEVMVWFGHAQAPKDVAALFKL